MSKEAILDDAELDIWVSGDEIVVLVDWAEQ